MLKNLMMGTAALALSVTAMVPVANAAVYNFYDDLLGGNEVPPSVSSAFGTLTGTYDDVSKVWSWAYFVNPIPGLGSVLESGHVHGPAPVGSNAPILIDLNLFEFAGATEPDGPFPALPDYSVSIDMDGGIGAALLAVVGIDLATFESHLLSESLYLNLHTAGIPTGEVRAQFLLVDAVPEPASLTLLGAGLIGLGRITRRKS